MDRAAEKNNFYSNGIDDEAKGKIFMPNIHRFKTKKSRRRTTLPHSVVQYHRREAPYRSCSGWERELQACCGHRE